MLALLQPYRNGLRSLVSTLLCGVLVIGLSLSTSAAMSAGGGGGGGGGGAGGGGAGSGGAGGGGGGGSAGAGGSVHRPVQPEPYRAQAPADDLTTCAPGLAWSTKKHKCLQRHGGVLPDAEMTEYAYALAKADRYQEALDVLDILQNPNTPRALNYRGYATRKLGRTDEGITYYLKSVALDPAYPQVREYLGEAYVIQGKFDLAKGQLARIEKLCGKECEYYQDLAEVLEQAHAL